MNRKGQALVEFVLILPIFIMILFVIVDFGMILNKKNELENISVDVVGMISNDVSISDIRDSYSDISIDINKKDKYINVVISDDVNIMTPGLNRILGKDYTVTVERNVPDVQA